MPASTQRANPPASKVLTAKATAKARRLAAPALSPVMLDGEAKTIWQALGDLERPGERAANARATALHLLTYSPYLTRLAGRFKPDFEAALTGCCDLEALVCEPTGFAADSNERDLMKALRQAKQRLALSLGVFDLAGRISAQQVSLALSRFADNALDCALGWLIKQAVDRGDIVQPEPEADSPLAAWARGSGFTVLALGKHGGRELNYSSDIDPIFLYEPNKMDYRGKRDKVHLAQRIGQGLIRMIEQVTEDGYVFRVDMRLRPDPSSTPLVISVTALESYYHAKALNWERAAFIKARSAAGNMALGDAFLDSLRSWIWRRSIDFAALDELVDLKSRIEDQAEKATNKGKRDIKVGRGGIREIEFFTQIQQLLFGGRDATLRLRDTQRALQALADAAHIDRDLAADMIAVYWQYRTLEHRLQMIGDQQTHSLPQNSEALEHLARFADFDSADALLKWYGNAQTFVRAHYAHLLPDRQTEGKTAGLPISEHSLSSYLDSQGFGDPEQAADIINGWRTHSYRALKAPRASGLLEDILAPLVRAFSQSPDPMTALLCFDRFLERLPAGIQLLTMLRAHPELLDRIARTFAASSATAEQLARHPERWGAVLEPGYFDRLGGDVDIHADLEQDLDHRLVCAADYEEALDIVRIFKAEVQLRVSLHLLEGQLDVAGAGAVLACTADLCLSRLYRQVHDRFAEQHGALPGSQLHCIALGRYGGGQLTTESDIDVVFYYCTTDAVDINSQSTGKRPLTPSQYYSRLGQQLITAITSLTREGRLYELDSRLRPCGAQGPLVVHASSVEKYYSTPAHDGGAWVWEYMAQTRARSVSLGEDTADCDRIDQSALLTHVPSDPDLRQAVLEMHEKLKARSTGLNWDIKFAHGGLVDAEFIIQYLLLRDIAADGVCCPPGLTDAVTLLETHESLSPQQKSLLEDAITLYEKLLFLLRLCFKSSRAVPNRLPQAVEQLVCSHCGAPDQQSLRKRLEDSRQNVQGIFQQILDI